MIDRQFLLLAFEPWSIVIVLYNPLDLCFSCGPNLRLQVIVHDAIEGGTRHETIVFVIDGRRLGDEKLAKG